MKKLVIGLVAALSASAFAAPRTVSITETTRDAAGHPVSFTLSFGGDDTTAHPLYMMYDLEDHGLSTNGWATVERLEDVAAGETTRVVPAPAELSKTAFALRFAVQSDAGNPTASSYVQDGLEVQWDGIENVGLGQHDATSTTWTDLTGHGFDWNLAASGWEWTANGLTLKGTATVGSMTKTPADLDNKVRMIEFVYANAEKRAGLIFIPGFGRTVYLYTDTDGHVGYYDYKGQAVPLNETECYSVAYTTAAGGTRPNGVSNCWLNGLLDDNDGMNDYWTPSDAVLLGGRNNTPYAKGTLMAMRIYSRVLDDAERDANFLTDSVRFQGLAAIFKSSDVVYDEPTWTFDTSTKKLTHRSSGWVLTASASDRNLTITGKDGSTAADPNALDLSGLVMTADKKVYTIATLAQAVFCKDETIRDVTLPLSLKTIAANAFYKCTALTNIVNFLPPGLTALGGDAFSGCTALASPLVMGDEVVGSGNFRFNNCPKLPSAVIGKKFTILEKQDFYGCTSLTNVVLPNTLTTISALCFYGCTGLKTISPFLPASVTSVGSDAFSGCTSIQSPLVLGAEQAISLPPNFNFYNCQSIPALTLGEISGVIPEYCFYNCTSVKNVYLTEHFPAQTTASRKPFAGWTDYQSRWIMPKDSAFWTDFVATSKCVTAWADLTPELQELYTSSYGDAYDCVGTIAMQFAPQWIVKPSSGGKFYATLQVVGTPEEFAADQVSPTYGFSNVTDLLPLTCSAPEYKAVYTTLWRCTGYQLERKLGEGEYEMVETGDVYSFTFNPEVAGEYRLTWNWQKVGYQTDITPFRGESPFAITTNTVATLEGFYPSGTVVSYTVTPTTSLPFVRWYGDIGENDPTNPTITLTMSGPHRVVPYFATPWRLNGAKNLISDGYWSNAVSVVNGEIKLSALQAEPLTGMLDLTKPIEGGDYTFVTLDIAVFENGGPSYSQWGEFTVKLPPTLRKIGARAFKYNASLTRVEPFLPDSVTFLGEDAFWGCSSLEGDLSLLSPDPIEFNVNCQFGACPKLRSATLGAGVTYLPSRDFDGCTGLTNVTFLGAITNIGATAFRGCTSLRHFEPQLPNTLTFVGDEAFTGCAELAGEVSIGWTKDAVVNFAYNKNFKLCTGLSSVRIGPSQMTLQSDTFYGCTGIQNVWIGGEFPTIVLGTGQTASMAWNAYQARIYLPKHVDSVENYIAANVTPWDDLAPAVQQLYLDAYPGEKPPIGLTKDVVWPNQWVVRWASPWLGQGFSIIVR